MADRVGQQLGHYRLLRVLGQGAFAEVYLAEHLYLERPAAIKVLHVQLESQTHEPFRREARTIAHLQHPHIVQVLDFGLHDQTPYLVMEYTPGGTLRSRYPKGTCLPIEQIVTYVKQIASALDYAHQQRVIHRDIKPDNLLLNAKGEIVLSDFGLAVVQRSLDSLSLSHPAAGSPLYMAPEQIQQHPCAASDQYALGVLVYEWLCGKPPFPGPGAAVFGQHLYQPPPSLCERLPHLPVAVEEVVFTALAKTPGQRFACVAEFASAFEQACEATQPLTSHGVAHQPIPEPTGADSTLFAPALTARPQEGTASSTHPRLMPAQQSASGQDAVSRLAPGPSLQPGTGSKQGKPSVAQNNRQRFLRRVRAFWIDGVLSHSLHGAALLTLGLQEQLDAVANPWHLVLQHADTAPRSCPLGTRITEVYDTANGELLLLGAPGSGKTTLLLELARDLLDRAEHDEQHLMPVVFPLSSWAVKQPRLTEWMVEELVDKYDVPRKLARTWIETDQILPLLDGLDEVALEKRTACIETINTYHQEHAFLPLVVASRSADYLKQTARLRLTSAVTVQSLTQQQVDDYLAHGGESLWALQVALHQDATLRELTETPLMLSILTLTYHDMPVEELLQGGIDPTRQQVFDHYTQRMLKHRGVQRGYTPKQTLHWLSRLAGQMKRQSQTVFYLEQMQPTWLSGHRMHGVYNWLAVRAPGVLMGVIVSLLIDVFLHGYLDILASIPIILLGGFLGGLLSTEHIPQRPAGGSGKAGSALALRLLRWLLMGALIGLGSGLSAGLIGGQSYGLSVGLSVGLCSILLQFLLRKNDTGEARSQAPPPARGTRWQHLIRRRESHNGLLVGLLVGLGYWLSAGLIVGLSAGLIDGLSAGLSAGLIAGVLSVLLLGRSTAVHPTDLLVWSWRSLGKSLFSKSHASRTMQVTVLIGLIVGLSHGLSIGLSYGLSYGLIFGLSYGLSAGLSFGLSFGLLLGLFQGVSSTTIEDQRRVVPNQGIHRSALNGLVFGLISTLIVGLSAGLSVGLSAGLSAGLGSGLSSGLSTGLSSGLSYGLQTELQAGLLAGLLVGLLYGGLASFRHFVVRFLLWRTGSLPWNYSHFLDYAAERVLLSKVGSGYIFIHRLLLEYFASLDTPPTSDVTKAKKEQAEPAS